jgi:hypothetical protein
MRHGTVCRPRVSLPGVEIRVSTVRVDRSDLTADELIGLNVHALMIGYGLTDEDLADALGLTRRQVNRLLAGRHGWDAFHVFQLGEFFGVAPESLVDAQPPAQIWIVFAAA